VRARRAPPVACLLVALAAGVGLASPSRAAPPGPDGGGLDGGVVLDGGDPQAPAFAPRPAAVLDPASFSHAGPLRVLASASGVTRVRLSPAVLSAARDDLADVRVVDAASRQWPFVIAPDVGHEPLELHLERDPPERGVSTWHLSPRVSPAVVEGLSLRIDRDAFNRTFRLLGEPVAGARVQLASGRLQRTPPAVADVTVSLSVVRVSAVTLVVDDGDEAPLPIVSAHAEARTAELRLVAPPGEYTLLAGDPDARAPRYEIAASRAAVLAAPASMAEMGKLAPNAAHLPQLPGGEARDKLVLWIVLGLAVVALGGLTLKLASREKTSEDRKPSA
jgi:hypothetical protein